MARNQTGRRRATVATETKVRDVMTVNPLTVGPDDTVRVAIGLMRERGIQHLPVVEDAGRLVGILTDRDIRHAALVPALAEHITWEHRRLKALRVRDVMTWSVVTTDPEASLVQAGWTMFQRRIGSLPVVDNARLVGILTEHDVLGALGKGDEIDPDSFVW
jgi:acetoin utilization protein AcuB